MISLLLLGLSAMITAAFVLYLLARHAPGWVALAVWGTAALVVADLALGVTGLRYVSGDRGFERLGEMYLATFVGGPVLLGGAAGGLMGARKRQGGA